MLKLMIFRLSKDRNYIPKGNLRIIVLLQNPFGVKKRHYIEWRDYTADSKLCGMSV